MSITTTLPRSTYRLSIDTIRNEARQMVEKGIISRSQPLYVLCEYLPAREWLGVECELERCDYLLRDHIGDLLSCEKWDND
ncbi:MAG: DUF4327 family protein [Xenococcaceae cyanobacterium MO_234.B1]|nr:DUF4327 family protein [Xenococcaceae cyanobacterium MO_234.B1]